MSKEVRQFTILIAVLAIIGGFVGGEITGKTFSLAGAFFSGLAVFAICMWLGWYFERSSQQQRGKRRESLSPEMRGMFDRMLGRDRPPVVDRAAAASMAASIVLTCFQRSVENPGNDNRHIARHIARTTFGTALPDHTLSRLDRVIDDTVDLAVRALAARPDPTSKVALPEEELETLLKQARACVLEG